MNTKSVPSLLVSAMFVLLSVVTITPTIVPQQSSTAANVLQTAPANTTNTVYWHDIIVKNFDSEIIFDSIVYLSGNITVEPLGFLWLKNCTIYLNSTYPYNSFTVLGTAMLTENTRVVLIGTGMYNLTFAKGSSGIVSDSIIEQMGERSLVYQSGTVKTERTIFRATSVNIKNTCLSLTNCFFEYSGTAISVRNSSAKLVNCTIHKSRFGINSTASFVSVENTTLSTLPLSGSYDVICSNSTVNCVNTSFDVQKVRIEDNKSLVAKEWFVTVFVNSSNGALSNASIRLTSSNSSAECIITTGTTGHSGNFNVTESVLYASGAPGLNRSTRNPHHITISKTGYLNRTILSNITKNSVISVWLTERYGSDWVFKNEDWIVNKTTVVQDEVMLLSGNLIVKDGGSLTLSNFTLILNCTTNGSYGVSIGNNSALRILSSHIRSYNTVQ